MKVLITREVFHKFPQLRVAFLLVRNLDNRSRLSESRHLLKETEKLIRLTFHPETLKNHHFISPWTVAQAEFGDKAVHYQTSTEKLIQKILAGKMTAARDTLTNLIRYLALKNVIPAGTDDLSKVSGNLTFALAKGGEKVRWLLLLKKGTFYYRDRRGILGTKLDYWKSGRTNLGRKTVSALVHFEALPPVTNKKLNEIVREAARLVKDFCGGKVQTFVLSRERSSMEI